MAEQRGGLPLNREVDEEEGRIGRRKFRPSDPETTPSDDDNSIVDGGRFRDAAADVSDDDYNQRRSLGQQGPRSPPSSPPMQTMSDTMAAPRIRSAVTKPVQLQLTGGRGRGTRGAGVMRLCRPHQSAEADENSTSGAQRGASAVLNTSQSYPVPTIYAPRRASQPLGLSFDQQLSVVDPRVTSYADETGSYVRTGPDTFVRVADAAPTVSVHRRLPSPPYRQLVVADIHSPPRRSEQLMVAGDVPPIVNRDECRRAESNVRETEDSGIHQF